MKIVHDNGETFGPPGEGSRSVNDNNNGKLSPDSQRAQPQQLYGASNGAQ
jgi:hypothetical protein